MAVDWSRLVIGPTVEVFGVRVLFNSGEHFFDITGVFDEAYLELTPLGRGGDDTETFSLGSPGAITSERPVLGVQLSQFPHYPKQGDTLEILEGEQRGERFVVKEVRPDGHGWAKLPLNRYFGI
jgi:hypothetical protein